MKIRCAWLCTLTMLAAAMVFGTGCLSLVPDDAHPGTGSAIILSAEARNLPQPPQSLLPVQKEGSAADIPLTSGLIRRIADRSRPAVVSVYVKTNKPYRLKILPFSPLGGIPVTVPGVGLGSGFFIHPSGYVLTNNHVVEDAEKITIRTSDGRDFDVAVLARDPAYDLALLKTNAPAESVFPILPMGDSDAVAAGDMVIAVGNPLGLGHTVTSGIISQTGRNLTGTPQEGQRQIDYIQTDTAINPGSSGGPLITLDGKWVAVNTAKAADAQGIGFAVPSKQVREFLNNIVNNDGEKEGQ